MGNAKRTVSIKCKTGSVWEDAVSVVRSKRSSVLRPFPTNDQFELCIDPKTAIMDSKTRQNHSKALQRFCTLSQSDQRNDFFA